MHDSLRSKLKAHEQAPPPNVWNKISRQLDEQFVPADASLSTKIENYSVPPPSHVWENIEKEIDSGNERATTKPGLVIPIFSRRIAAAVILLAIIAAGSFYFFTGNSDEQLAGNTPSQTVVEKSNLTPPNVVESTPKQEITKEEPEEVQSRRIFLSTPEPRKQRSSRSRREAPVNAASFYNEASFVNTIDEAHVSTPQPVSERQFITVSAPPIRDGNGNIIMDLDVISKPGQQYITVTSPNGHQTRISNKFLNCLRYINGNITAAEMDGNALECRTQFENWRNKLLSDGSFIPAADNFFDIFELKEMIED